MKSTIYFLQYFITLVFQINYLYVVYAQLSENERVSNWYTANNTWPPNWQPERPSFSKVMELREEEIQLIPGNYDIDIDVQIGSNERWANYLQYTQSRLLPRFTEVGFEIIPTPINIHERLRARVQDAIDHQWETLNLERQIDVVYTPLPSKFVNMNGLGGMKLKPTSAYGVRLYQNGSSLVMHYDKTHTHVISSIIHIAHEYDNDDEPWPIEIEDHNGVIHSVNLEAGQMLFYESAVCLHGRRKRFKGKYYGSLFVHYQPVDINIWNYTIEDVVASVPPHWRDNVVEPVGSRLSGSGLTVDSLIPDGGPDRVINGQVIPDIRAFYQERKENINRKETTANNNRDVNNDQQQKQEEL